MWMNNPPLHRALHVLGGLNPGGVENWLLDIVRHGRPSGWRFDFCLLGSEASLYAAELERHGCRILRCPVRPFPRFAARFYRLLRGSRYDLVHSHVHHFSGVVLSIARAAGVPARIAHIHSSSDGRGRALGRRFYQAVMHRALDHSMTLGLSCATSASDQLLGKGRRHDGRIRTMPCGIDLEAFEGPAPNRSELRREFGFPPGTHVAGHIGRLEGEKNQQFLLQIAAHSLRLVPNLRWVIVGDGSLRYGLRRQAQRLGIADRVVFAGVRRDVPRLLSGLFDVFLLPSLREGIPIAALEAQAAAVPTLLSDRVPPETVVVAEIVERLQLEAGPAAWAAGLQRALHTVRPLPALTCQRLRQRHFDVRDSFRQLIEAYGHASAVDDPRPIVSDNADVTDELISSAG